MTFYNVKAKAIEFINSMIPKGNAIYLFSSFLYKDNIQCLLDEMIRQRVNDTFVIYCDGPAFECYTGKNILIVEHGSLHALKAFFSSSYVFYDIGIYGQIKGGKKQVLVNTWHGTSLKKIEYYLEKNARKGMPPLCTYSIAYSNFFKPIIQKAFGLDNEHVLVTGEPRNDYLYSSDKEKILRALSIEKSNQKLVLWMPTWRQNKINNSENEGAYYELGIPLLNKAGLTKLNEACIRNNTLLVIKWHGLQQGVDINENDYQGIRFLTSESIAKTKLPLYYLVGCSDALITDYSSIYVNYLVLNRPICFAYDDIEKYKENRGFMFDDVEKIMPGIHVNSLEGVIGFIDHFQDPIFDKPYSVLRESVNEILNSYSDCQNSRRLLVELGII